jgi:hypothetical protein
LGERAVLELLFEIGHDHSTDGAVLQTIERYAEMSPEALYVARDDRFSLRQLDVVPR